MTSLSHLISTMPACWRDDYKRAVARSVLSTNRAAYDGATGLPNGNGNMMNGYHQTTRDRRPRGQGRDQLPNGKNPSMIAGADQIDSGTLLDFVNMAYHRLPPDEQDQLCQGLSDLIASHQNPTNGDQEEGMEPRGSSSPNSLLDELGGNTATFSPLESMSGTRTPGSPGGQDKNIRRFTTLHKKRRPAQDQVLASSRRQRQEAGFLTRFPSAAKINVGGHY